MCPHDAESYAGDLHGWRSEITARMHDFLARKASFPGSEKVGGFLRKMENAVSTAALKTAVRELLHYLRREKVEPEAHVEDTTGRLFHRIREAGRKESIESYGTFLFTVDTDLRL